MQNNFICHAGYHCQFLHSAFAVFADQLRQDCWRHGHPCHIQLVDCPFANLIQVFDHKVEWIREQVIKFGRVIWLDVECRLLRPILLTGLIPS